MYFGNGQGRGPRRQLIPPRDRPQAPAQPQSQPIKQPQVMRHAPQAAVAIPPLPEEADERAVNVIQLESKGKEKIKELEVIPVKKTRVKKALVSKEVTGPPASMETDEEGTLERKRKKRSSTRRKITIKDFPLV